MHISLTPQDEYLSRKQHIRSERIKALKLIRSIFVWLMVALAVFMMIFTIVSVSTFDRAETQHMMQELLQMKAQMAQNGGETPKTDETPSDTTTV